jgi:acetyltransferase-like isoleucine patch superfamily enzyme
MILSAIKYFYFKILYAYKFPNSVIYSGVKICKQSKIGKKTVLFDNVKLINSNIGAYTYIQKNTDIYDSEIGNFCSIASNVQIGLGFHPMDFISTSPIFYDCSQPLPEFFTNNKFNIDNSQRVIIGSDVWIGVSSIIKSGITIGVGSVIGAGSIVTKDVPPYSIVVGVPAKIIKYRFDNDLIAQLIESKWWELDKDILKQLNDTYSDPKIFLNQLKCLIS